MDKLIITAAITGGFTFKAMNENVPITPKEIAEEVERRREAGASIVHLHPKKPDIYAPDPDNLMAAFPSEPNEILGQYIDAINDSDASDIIINATTGGGRFVSRDIDEVMEERTKLGQEVCSLNIGSINIWDDLGFPDMRSNIFENSIARVERWAGFMYENGVKPEVEIYDTGMINTAKSLVREGKLKEPLHIQFVMMGGLSCMSPDLVTLAYCTERIPDGWTWSVCAGGVNEMRMAAASIVQGGHVRVGFEDNIYIDPDLTLISSFLK